MTVLYVFAGCVLSAIVTLDSIEIYSTHELLKQPTVYFKCKGDQNKTLLPDVNDKKSCINSTAKSLGRYVMLCIFNITR